MRKILLILLIVAGSLATKAQSVSISPFGAPSDTSAMLDISASPAVPKGVLIPRLRTIERTAIYAPANGLLVYDINTTSFWYCSFGVWKEIPTTLSQFPPSGLASGDLSGSYPSPTVSKIQNLSLSTNFPFDYQTLKWHPLNNQWQAMNDSLFLPYNVTFGSPTKLFGITNTNTTPGATAVYGKSGNTGSGITPAGTSGVWGDNSSGFGVIGTANTGQGVYGFSLNNNGVQGYSVLAGMAGVYGSHANDNGFGVMGETQNNGFAVYGKTTGSNGKAGMFESTSALHADTTLKVKTPGLGTLSSFIINNINSIKPAIDIQHAGNGNGLKLRLTKINGAANAIDVLSQGTGIGVYSKSENGIAAKFEIVNAVNALPAMMVGTNGLGTSLYVSSANTGLTGNVVDVINQGDGLGLSVNTAGANTKNVVFTSSNTNNFEPNLFVEHNGSGRGVEIKLTKASNNNAGLYINTAGNKGAEIISAGSIGVAVSTSANNAVAVSANTGQTADNAIGVKGTTGANVNNGIGVLGQAGLNDPNGIGVKGVSGGGIVAGIGVLGVGNSNNPQAIGVKGTSYTHNEDVGAVTGINFADGVGVYGESTGFDGIGVAGTVGNTGNHSVAGVFTNNYNNNNRAVIELISNGKGNSIFSDNTNLSNTSPLLRIRNSGTGQFLRFETGLGDIVTTIEKSGNITTDGTITVKTNKGIVRNSTATQLRMESREVTFAAGSLPHYDDSFNAVVTVSVTFDNAFSTAPSVYIGNFVSGGFEGLTLKIVNVTTTGCEVRLSNFTPYNFAYATTIVKIIAIGAE